MTLPSELPTRRAPKEDRKFVYSLIALLAAILAVIFGFLAFGGESENTQEGAGYEEAQPFEQEPESIKYEPEG